MILIYSPQLLSGLKVLVDVCKKYVEEYNIGFNSSKNRLLPFKGRQCKVSNRGIIVNGVLLNMSQSAVDLGHHVCTNDKDHIVTAAKTICWRSFDLFMSDYGHIYSFLKGQLFVQYCCSYYDSPSWTLSDGELGSLCVVWRKALRAIWRIHPLTHCDIISAMTWKFIDFNSFNKCISCENGVKSFICKSNPMSCACNNYKLLLNDQNEFGVLDMIEWKMKYTELIDNVYVLKEMIDV